MLSSNVLQPNTILNGRYRLLERLGDGGMATVYRAIDTRLGRNVAIKVLHAQYAHDEPFLQRFQQEAEFAASLGSHPNIVAIYDVGQDDVYHYIVMELIEGRNLKESIQERAPFSVPEAFAIAQQVASALDFAHKRGLIHRDVKPQNIMVTADGVAKVTDFGIARTASASQLTRTGMVIGTVHYFSPEQAQGKPAGPPSDIYSLGVILYEMLTGHLPFDAETPIGVAMQHLHSPPPSPWDYQPNLPAQAVSTLLRALEKDPERRYRDAAEFASALSTPPSAQPSGTTTLSPITEPETYRTNVYQSTGPVPRPVARSHVVPAAPDTKAEASQQRLRWIAIGLAALIAAIVAGSLFATHHLFAGGSAPTATATATATPKPTPKPRHHPTPRPTLPVVIAPVYTPTPTPIPPAPTLPPPTYTPVPIIPTSTPPPPTPTPTPIPKPTPSPTPVAPTPSPTPVG